MSELVEAIKTSIEDRGYPPSVRELAEQFGCSVGTIHKRLVQAEAEGKIVREGYRAIRIIEGETE